tara:strand:- start:53 stop:583 length:531 start_codon:yes stop_codon:yes gene_type:complete
MKILTIIMLITISSGTVLGQSKKEIQSRVSELEEQLNDEKVAHEKTSTTLSRYQVMYDAIREKVLPYDFEPENTSAIIDSLHANRDSTLMNITGRTINMADQIDSLNIEIDSHKLEIDSQKFEIDSLQNRVEFLTKPLSEISEGQLSELKKIKDLMDSGILTQEEFSERKKVILKL